VKISKALKAVYKLDGISVIQNGCKSNDLRHYHMHVFPRYEGDGFAWVEPKDVTDAKNRLITGTADIRVKIARGTNSSFSAVNNVTVNLTDGATIKISGLNAFKFTPKA
jgi:hypothetical protein